MRFQPTRVLYALGFTSTCILIGLLLRLRNPHFTKTCIHSNSFQSNLHVLTYRVHHALNILSLTHSLCYGALWGQIRQSSSLPWEADVEFCIQNEEISALNEIFLVNFFQKHNLTSYYDSAEGIYNIIDELLQPGASVRLVVFEKETLGDKVRRVGWKRRMLPPNCEDMTSLECFPARLMIKPLPLRDFGGHLLPVPREEIEILKYHYADNWWVEKIPLNC